MNQKNKNPMLTLSLAIIIGIFSIITAIVQYNEKINEKKQADASEVEVKKYRQRLESSQKKQIELQEENKKLTIENLELSNESLKYSTGFDSYPIVVISGFKSRGFKGKNTEETLEFNILSFNLINKGEYPLRNVKVLFNDNYGNIIGEFISVGKSTIAQEPDKRFESLDTSKELVIGTLPKNEILRDLYRTTIPQNLDSSFNIKVVWDSGSISYEVDVKNNGNDLSFIYSGIHSDNSQIDDDEILTTIIKFFTKNKYSII